MSVGKDGRAAVEEATHMPNRWLTFCEAIGQAIGYAIVFVLWGGGWLIGAAVTVFVGYHVLRLVGLL